jgi:hypothetical protein
MRINYNEQLLLKEELYIYNMDKLEVDRIAERINNFYFRSKAELILVLLKFYEYFLDKKDYILKRNSTRFTFDYYPNIKRIIIKHNEKHTSIVSLLSLYEEETQRLLKLISQDQTIEIQELSVLIQYYLYLVANSKELLAWDEEYDNINGILNDYKVDDESYSNVSIDSILLLNSQLRYHDTAYFRYEIDFENSIEVDRECNLVIDRIFYHPPYHMDMDYRDASNYKIAFDGDISNNILDIFQVNHTHAFMVKADYHPNDIKQRVQVYFDNLPLSSIEKKKRYSR